MIKLLLALFLVGVTIQFAPAARARAPISKLPANPQCAARLLTHLQSKETQLAKPTVWAGTLWFEITLREALRSFAGGLKRGILGPIQEKTLGKLKHRKIISLLGTSVARKFTLHYLGACKAQADRIAKTNPKYRALPMLIRAAIALVRHDLFQTVANLRLAGKKGSTFGPHIANVLAKTLPAVEPKLAEVRSPAPLLLPILPLYGQEHAAAPIFYFYTQETILFITKNAFGIRNLRPANIARFNKPNALITTGLKGIFDSTKLKWQLVFKQLRRRPEPAKFLVYPRADTPALAIFTVLDYARKQGFAAAQLLVRQNGRIQAIELPLGKLSPEALKTSLAIDKQRRLTVRLGVQKKTFPGIRCGGTTCIDVVAAYAFLSKSSGPARGHRCVLKVAPGVSWQEVATLITALRYKLQRQPTTPADLGTIKARVVQREYPKYHPKHGQKRSIRLPLVRVFYPIGPPP